ncbi:MAG: transcriptional regulator [Clostridiales bacterium]|nr:transcriptional regulator [Clostridiales bacterium]
MNPLRDALRAARPLWAACLRTPFVQGLCNATLPMRAFRGYLLQDSLYLQTYARVWGAAIFLSPTQRKMRLHYTVLRFVTQRHSAVRLCWLDRFGMTDAQVERLTPWPVFRAYGDFLMDTARGGSLPRLMMAALPCMLGYAYVFRAVAASPAALRSPYRDYILDHTEPGYLEDCRRLSAYTARLCAACAPRQQRALNALFLRASAYELQCWRRASRGLAADGHKEENNL